MSSDSKSYSIWWLWVTNAIVSFAVSIIGTLRVNEAKDERNSYWRSELAVEREKGTRTGRCIELCRPEKLIEIVQDECICKPSRRVKLEAQR